MSSKGLDDAIARAFYVERFDDFLALEQGASVQTSKAYKLDIARFVTYVSVKGAAAASEVGTRVLREYVYHLKDLGLAPASIRRNVSAVRSYFKFLLGEGLVVRDPSERLETPKRWRTLPEVLGVEEVEKLLAAPSLDEPLAFRDRAMLELAYGAGLRVSEWISLSVRDVMLKDHLIRVFGKGAKERLVPIGRKAIGATAIYLRELRPSLEKGEGKGVLFLNARGQPLSRMGRLENPQKICEAGRNNEARFAPHSQAFFCDPPARGWRGSEGCPGDVGTRGHRDDADIHAYRSRIPAERSQAIPPPLLNLSR